MPTDVVLLTIAFLAFFACFAAVLFWADAQTRKLGHTWKNPPK